MAEPEALLQEFASSARLPLGSFDYEVTGPSIVIRNVGDQLAAAKLEGFLTLKGLICSVIRADKTGDRWTVWARGPDLPPQRARGTRAVRTKRSIPDQRKKRRSAG